MTYMTAIFGSCPTCHTEFGHAFDQDTVTRTQAREGLRAKIEQCEHNGLGQPIVDMTALDPEVSHR